MHGIPEFNCRMNYGYLKKDREKGRKLSVNWKLGSTFRGREDQECGVGDADTSPAQGPVSRLKDLV